MSRTGKEKRNSPEKKRSVGRRILFLAVLLILMILIAGFTGLFYTGRLGKLNLDFLQHTYVDIIHCHELKEKMEEIHLDIVIHIGFNNETDKKNIENEINDLNRDVFQDLESLSAHYVSFEIKQDTSDGATQEEPVFFNTYFEDLYREWEKYNANIELILQLSNIGDSENSFYFYTDNGRLIFNRAMERIDTILAVFNTMLQEATTFQKTAMDQARLIILCILSIGTVASILLSAFIIRSITRPLKLVITNGELLSVGIIPSTNIVIRNRDEIGRVAAVFNTIMETFRTKGKELSVIAQGDLSLSISRKSDDDSFADSMIDMVSSLNSFITDIRQSMEQAGNGASQLADTSQILSKGAVDQAGAIEEISSSLTEMGSQLKETFEHTKAASALATSTTENAAAGNKKMQNIVVAMENISKGAGEIKRIVKIIDDIAFQTNLLALNANVEAARAGKYGKGFAVVANEVRALATRSALSVDETTEMVEQAVANISNGNALVQETAEQFHIILQSSNKVNELLKNIAESSDAQNGKLTQITHGLEQIDTVTQHNSASSEQTASAAEELAGMVDHLNALQKKFVLVEDSIVENQPEEPG